MAVSASQSIVIMHSPNWVKKKRVKEFHYLKKQLSTFWFIYLQYFFPVNSFLLSIAAINNSVYTIIAYFKKMEYYLFINCLI